MTQNGLKAVYDNWATKISENTTSDHSLSHLNPTVCSNQTESCDSFNIALQ